MLSIWKLVFGSIAYYLGLASEDYYHSGGEPPGRWGGSGAKALGLPGNVTRKALGALFRGVNPDSGAGLVQNADDPRRCPGWDFTWCPPKDVSILATLPSLYQKIRDAQERAVRYALGIAEKNFAFTRVGSVRKGQWQFKPVRLIAALFEHMTSRLNDMLLHTHSLIVNMGVDEEGVVRALHSSPLFKARNLLGAYYRAYLVYILDEELGLVCERVGDSFRIKGVPKRLVRFWSKRRQEIEAEMRKNGVSGGKAAAKATLKTRRTKKDVPPRDVLLKRWRRANAARGFGPWCLPYMQHWKKRNPERDLPRALAKAVKNLSRRGSHFSEMDLLKETLMESVNYAISPDLIPPAVKQHLQSADEIVPLKEVDGEKRYATKSIIEMEKRLLENVDRLLDRRGPRANPQLVERVLAKRPLTNPEQAQAVRHLTMGRGSIRTVSGLAGVGKTSYVIRPCLEIWKKEGYKVIGATPTGAAAQVLEQETGIPTDTIHMRLADFDRSFGFAARHHVKQFWRASRGRRTYRLKRHKPVKVGPKTILVVDETGMVNTRHMDMLIERVLKGGGTVVFLGDARQIKPVEGGAPFESICTRTKAKLMQTVLRQKEEWARQAVKHFYRGETVEALKLFAERDLITVREGMDEALETLVDDWAEKGVDSPEQAAIIVNTNQQSEKANKLCQQRRIDAGRLNPSYRLKIRDDLDGEGESLKNVVHVGDRVLFTRNDRRFGVSNGQVGTVTAMKRMQRKIAVQLDGGKTVVIPVHKYRHLRLGYSETTHKLQGGTLPHVFVLAGGGMQDLPISYVQGSRAVVGTRFYTATHLLDLDDIENSALPKIMGRKPDLRLAVDLLDDDAAQEPARSGIDASPTDDRSEDQVELPDSLSAELPQVPRPQPEVPSKRRSRREECQDAAAALRRQLIQRRVRQRRAYAMAQAEWEQQKRLRDETQANLMASFNKNLKWQQAVPQPLLLATSPISQCVERLVSAAEIPNQCVASLIASAFSDTFEEPPVRESQPNELLAECLENEAGEVCEENTTPDHAPPETSTTSYQHNESRVDDYDPWEEDRARRAAEPTPATSSSSSSFGRSTSHEPSVSQYSTYNEANRAYSDYQTCGAAQTAASNNSPVSSAYTVTSTYQVGGGASTSTSVQVQ